MTDVLDTGQRTAEICRACVSSALDAFTAVWLDAYSLISAAPANDSVFLQCFYDGSDDGGDDDDDDVDYNDINR